MLVCGAVRDTGGSLQQYICQYGFRLVTSGTEILQVLARLSSEDWTLESNLKQNPCGVVAVFYLYIYIYFDGVVLIYI